MERVFGDFPWVLRAPLPELAPERARVKDIVLAEFREWDAPKQQYSFPIRSYDPFFGQLYERFFAECLRTFQPFSLHVTSRRNCFAYVQNNASGASVWHDHLQTSTINGVYYLSVPDPSGQLWFMFREHVLKTTPEQGWLYLFPRWLLHKPVPQRSPDYRVSLNVELISNECPILRDEPCRW
ncbi:MAG: hypothetical protein WA840_09515 [Caulobacteraceae bacterium]